MEIVDSELRRYDQWKADLESCRTSSLARSEDSIMKNNSHITPTGEQRR